MEIIFDPIRADDTLSVHVDGDVLTVNGDVLDFSGLAEGFKLPPSAVGNAWIIGSVKRRDGQIQLTMLAPHGGKASEAARVRYSVTVDKGHVELRK